MCLCALLALATLAICQDKGVAVDDGVSERLRVQIIIEIINIDIFLESVCDLFREIAISTSCVDRYQRPRRFGFDPLRSLSTSAFRPPLDANVAESSP